MLVALVRLDKGEERISKLKKGQWNLSKHKEKNKYKTEQHIQELWNNNNWSNICTIKF